MQFVASARGQHHGRRWGCGGDQATKGELAYRLALCWNLAEDWPTEVLEKGILRSVEDTLVQVLELLEVRSEVVPDDARSSAFAAPHSSHGRTILADQRLLGWSSTPALEVGMKPP